jgi:hypothetical protein
MKGFFAAHVLLPSTPMSPVLALLGLAILAHGHVALAATDSVAARNARVPDSTIRWQFDTGG